MIVLRQVDLRAACRDRYVFEMDDDGNISHTEGPSLNFKRQTLATENAIWMVLGDRAA